MRSSTRDQRLRAMHQLYREGATLDAVGERFGVSGARVSQLFSGAGLPTRRGRRPGERKRDERTAALGRQARERARARQRAARAKEMYAVYAEVATLEEVGRQFGLTRERVRQIFAAAGLPTRDRSEMHAPRRNAHLSRGGEIVAAYQRLGSMSAVRRELQIPLSVVTEIIHRERPEPPPRRRRRRYRYSRDQLLERLTEAAELHRGPLTMTAYERVRWSSVRRRRRWPVPETYFNRFGSWADALSAAGLPATGWPRGGCRYSKEDCLSAVARLAAQVGTEPTIREYDAWAKARQGVPSFTTVVQRCGTWRNAVRQARAPTSR